MPKSPFPIVKHFSQLEVYSHYGTGNGEAEKNVIGDQRTLILTFFDDYNEIIFAYVFVLFLMWLPINQFGDEATAVIPLIRFYEGSIMFALAFNISRTIQYSKFMC